MLTQERLKEYLHYDQDTGVFKWAVSRGRVKEGDEAGRKGGLYRQISLHGVFYLSHRLAWLYVYGYFPENSLDHIDKDKKNNRIANLREASTQCNMRNTGNYANNTSGVKGVVWNKSAQKWYSYLCMLEEKIYLGSRVEKLEAVCLRLAAEQAVDWAGCDSSSPAYQYVKEHIEIK